MKIDGIYNIREHRGRTFTDIVYEWETDLAAQLGVPVLRWGSAHTLGSAVARHVPACGAAVKRLLFGDGRRYLRFVMSVLEDTPIFNHRSCVPVIIDYFVGDDRLADFARIYSHCECVLISSRQAYDHLRGKDLPFRVAHFPLTLSDRYAYTDQVYRKRHALTLLGTQIYDKELRAYIDRYRREHPGFEYVYKEEGSERYVTSTGAPVCDARDRDEYLQLIRDSKVTVYSTPAQRGHRHCNGFDPVTPKFLEMVASQCHVLLKYSANSDADYFGLRDFGRSIATYADFAAQLDSYLATDFDTERGRRYLAGHLTSTLIPLLSDI